MEPARVFSVSKEAFVAPVNAMSGTFRFALPNRALRFGFGAWANSAKVVIEIRRLTAAPPYSAVFKSDG